MNTDLDIIGNWSEIKIEIIQKFSGAYANIMSKQRFHYAYIDGFAGAGLHISKDQKTLVPGSPLNALLVSPPFNEYHFVDLDKERAGNLEELRGNRKNVHVYNDDCNVVLLNEILPKIRYDQYRRALCVLDPYGLQLNWEVLALAGSLETVDIFLNFPIMDMNRNVLRHDTGSVKQEQIDRMNAFWGDDSWRKAAYSSEGDLFGYESKTTNQEIVNAFRERLKKIAGFECVPPPMPMRNSRNSVVYYLFFASPQPVAEKIAKSIFKKYGSVEDN